MPDFFVVGAPRCGTTALCRYLARNPQVCFSRPKEPHYFARHEELPTVAELQRDYLDQCFPHYSENHRVVGEGSVSYLHLPDTLRHIVHFNPAARFLVMLRNPLTMLPSYHLRMRYLLQEDEEDFETAWNLEPMRERNESLPPCCVDSRLLMYSSMARYGAQLQRLFDIAGREQVHVVIFDDFVANPLDAYQGVLKFLGVDYDGQTEFERRYESRLYRVRWLQRLLFVPAVKGGKIGETLQRKARKYNADGSKAPSLIKKLAGLNRVSVPPTPLTPRMVTVVSESVRPDLELLSNLLGRDLTHWLSPQH